MKIRLTSEPINDDPGKKKVMVKSRKPTAKEVEDANRFAKDFAVRRNLLSGENTHTGGQVPKFIDARTGKELMPGDVQPPVGKLSKTVPLYVKSLEWDDRANLPFYIDEKTGDTQYVAKELFYSPRFSASRAKPMINPIARL